MGKIKGADLYNNTIANSLLMPTTDSLAEKEALGYDSNVLSSTADSKTQSFKDHLETVNQKSIVLANSFSVQVKYGSSLCKLENLESIEGLSVSREVEGRPIGGFSGYLVKLPGPVQYAPVTFGRFQCNNDTFYRWLISGINQGGIKKADFHITMKSYMVNVCFSLIDAFPTQWSLGEMTTPDSEGKNLQVMESLTIVYGKMEVEIKKL